MKTHKGAFYVSLCILFLFHLSCSKQQVAEWRGSIEKLNGVTVVNNPSAPLFGELVFDLVEDLSIGNLKDDKYLFSVILRIEVDSEGNIYVLEDSRNRRAQKFSPKGEYLCSFGRMGQGPGEFQAPYPIIIDDKNGQVALLDIRKILVFDKRGNHLNRDIPLNVSLLDLWVDAKGSKWGRVAKTQFNSRGDVEIREALVRLANDGEIDRELESYPLDIYAQRSSSGTIAAVASLEEYRLQIVPITKGGFVFGYSNKYEMKVLNPDGNLVRMIRKEEPVQYFSAEETNKYRRAKLPEHKPFFYLLFSDSEGRLYAQKNNARLADSVDKEFDIFSKDGYYLYRTKCPLTPFVIANGFFYTRTENDATGDVFIKRYKIRNWNEIKNDI